LLAAREERRLEGIVSKASSRHKLGAIARSRAAYGDVGWPMAKARLEA
jgi:hypothetical protein